MPVLPGLGISAALLATGGRQILRPDSEISQVQINAGTYLDVDEAVASDADHITAKKNIIAHYRMGLSNPASAVPAGTASLRFRAANANAAVLAGTPFITLTVEIYEGATLRASTTQVLTDTLTTYSWNPDLSAVTNFNNLEVLFAQPAVSQRNFLISHVELDLPA